MSEENTKKNDDAAGRNYLRIRGWVEVGGMWVLPDPVGEFCVPMQTAIEVQRGRDQDALLYMLKTSSTEFRVALASAISDVLVDVLKENAARPGFQERAMAMVEAPMREFFTPVFRAMMALAKSVAREEIGGGR